MSVKSDEQMIYTDKQPGKKVARATRYFQNRSKIKKPDQCCTSQVRIVKPKINQSN
jgi:hypothetical protein